MTDNERLVDWITNAKQIFPDISDKELADYLCDNGMIAPPCKINDILYIPSGKNEILKGVVVCIDVRGVVRRHVIVTNEGYDGEKDFKIVLNFEDIGVRAFFDEKKAENEIIKRGEHRENIKHCYLR